MYLLLTEILRHWYLKVLGLSRKFLNSYYCKVLWDFARFFASAAKLKISFTGPKLGIWHWKNTFRDLLYNSLLGRPSRGWLLGAIRRRPIRALLPKYPTLQNQYMENLYFLQPVLRRTCTIYCKIEAPIRCSI